MLQIFAVSGLINAIVAVTFGLLVIAKNWRDTGNRIFFLMTAALAAWGVSYWLWLSAADGATALFWLRLLSVASIFIPVLFFHWISALLSRLQGDRMVIIIAYTASAFISLFAGSELFVSSVGLKLFFPYWPDAGILYTIYIFTIYAALILYSLYILVRVSIRSPDIELRGRIVYILTGAILGFGGGFTNFLLWYNIFIPPYGTFLVVAFPFLLGYAALKHQLFSLKAIASEILVFFICVVLLIEFALSRSAVEAVLRGTFFGVAAIAGYLLIRSVYREVEQRQRIEAQEKALEVANRQQESLLHFISHEIKGYLTKNEAAFAAIASGDFGETSDALKHMSESALEDTRRGVDTAMDILDAANLKKGTVAFNKKAFDFCKIAEQTTADLKRAAAEKGISLSYVCSSEPLTVIGDEDKIRRHVIHNIVDNSIRYTPSGSIQMQISKEGDVIRFTVTDTGVGITPEDMRNLFTEGGHGAESIKINVHSTGYGLFIAKEIVEAHGGKIWAESDGKGKGSRFIVEFPASA